MKDHALEYAKQGYPTLWTYGITRDEETGELSCTCPNPKGPACKQGKHPAYGGHGAYDATTDESIIEGWPDDGNFGLGLSDTLVAIDIDDPSIASALLDPEICLRDIATISITGRIGGGIHNILRCAPTRNGILKRRDTGQRIGEIRAQGQYIILPPSLHESGRHYTWLGRTLLRDGPTITTSDGWAYAKEMLSWAGVELQDKRDSQQGPTRESKIVEQDKLPFQTTNATLLSLMQPVYPDGDRSASLFRLACELVREARAHPTERIVLAGVVKHVDRIRVHPKGPKFLHRDNADDYYWDIMHEAEQAVGADEAKASEDTDTSAGSPDAHGSYYYDDAGGFIDNRNPKAPRRICNFEPRILELILSWTGDGLENNAKADWVIQVRRGEEQYTMRVRPSEYNDARTLVKALNELMPPGFVIDDGKQGVFKQAIQEMAAQFPPPTRTAYAVSGWLPHEDAFLIPGLVGAVTPTGYDYKTLYEPTDSAPPEMGAPRLIDQDASLERVLKLVLDAGPPRVIIPIFSQLLAAPLVSLGLPYKTVAHVYGPTNTFKTSLVTNLMSLYGHSSPVALGIDSWGSTARTIQAKVYHYRDLPFMVDDFKAGTSEENFVNSLIQAYGDDRGRGRLDRNAHVRKQEVPRGLLITTGEDVWQGQRSTLSRTLIVRLEDGMIDRDVQLVPLRKAAETGQLGLLGVSWIQWLAGRTKATIETSLRADHEVMLPGVEKFVGTETARITSSVTSLMVVTNLFSQFVKETIPSVHDLWRDVSKTGWTWQMSASKEQSDQGLQLTPLTQLLRAVKEQLALGAVSLPPRTTKDKGLGVQGALPVGWADDIMVYFTEDSTWAWFLDWRRRQGRPPGFSWDQVKREAKKGLGATNQMSWIAELGESRRLLAVPLDQIIGDIETSL